MGKIKLNLISGTVIEKPLINAFSGNNSTYVVLDNEMNGSMGLPIILVSKLEGNKLTKIVDQNEWQAVKELLKKIIAGSETNYVKLGEELSADDIYYTQLTLPVPSFDALKNSYQVDNNISNDATILDINPAMPTANVEPVPSVSSPVSSSASTIDVPQAEQVSPNIENTSMPPINDIVAPVNPIPEVSPAIPEEIVNPSVETSVNMSTPIDVATPLSEPASTIPEMPINNDVPTQTNEISFGAPLSVSETNEEKRELEPEITPTPVINANIPNRAEENIFAEQKEAFMQACENMFDALVQKFEKELENRK